MHPSNCPGWEYSTHPQKDNVLPIKSKDTLISLRKNISNYDHNAIDSRSTHQYLFSLLTPKNYGYYAGNYRGAAYRCLEFYEVMISSDSRVGDNSSCVHQLMTDFGIEISNLFAALDLANQIPNSQLPHTDKFMYLVAAASHIFVEFLRIHPYANGNGHIARFLIFIFLGRHGYWPKKWPLDERPPDPPYSTLISEYRNGQKDPLEQFIMKCILGTI